MPSEPAPGARPCARDRRRLAQAVQSGRFAGRTDDRPWSPRVFALASGGQRPVAGAVVELWDEDFPPGPTSDDYIAVATTDDDGEFRFDFEFDPAHGYDPASIPIGGRIVRVGLDLLKPYIKVKLFGVDEGHVHALTPEPAVPPGSPSPRIAVTWTAPTVCLPQDEGPLDRLVRSARQGFEALPYQWQALAHIAGAPDVAFDPPVWVLSPLADGLGLIDDIALPFLEVNGLLNRAPGGGESYIDERKAAVAEIVEDREAAEGMDFSRPETFREMFGHVGAPESVARVGSDGKIPDAWFAEQRLTGLNPMKICRLGSKEGGTAPPGFAPLAQRVRQVTRSSWGDLVSEGRLYVCDYRMLRDIAEKYPHEGRYLPAPYAVFYRTTAVPSTPASSNPAIARRGPTSGSAVRVRPVRPELMPLGIQTRPDGPVHMPGDGAEWEFAKLQVQVADVNLHEMVYHLWGCHVSMEPFAIASARAFAVNHPLRELFRRHFFGLLWINQYGLRHLINTSGDPRRPVQDFLAPSFSGSMELMRIGRAWWSIAKKALPRDLEDRGLHDPDSSLRVYPYRDDGLLVWRAIQAFVGEYLDLYYDDPADVRDDSELESFYEELRTHDVPDILRPDNPDVARNLVHLKEHVTQILWVSSAVHTAVNAPQFPMAGYAGNLPTASNLDPAGPAPANVTEVYVQGNNPHDNSKQRAAGMMGLTGELSLYNPDEKAGGLGHYRWWGRWRDRRVEPILDRFRGNLAEAERAMVEANGKRPLKWEWMRPSKIANSTST